MRGFRGGMIGALAALLLAGCASYPASYYYDDGYAGGDYYYDDSAYDDGAYADYGYSRGYDDSGYWSPAWSTYYSSILYPPYWRSYDPWYTPGWYYGTAYAPGARWRYGWSSAYYDPWWRSGWYSPYRYGSYNPYWYGGHYGYYDNDSSWAWRERERRYGRRAYRDDRRSGGDTSAADMAERIARRNGTAGSGRDTNYGAYGGGVRGGAPSAYDRRPDNDRSGRPSRFGNPQGAGPSAPTAPRGAALEVPDRRYGNRDSGWIAPAEGVRTRRSPSLGAQDSEPDAISSSRWREGDAYRTGGSRRSMGSDVEPPRNGDNRDYATRGGWQDRSSRVAPLAPRESPRYEAPRANEDYARPQRFEAPSRNDSARFESSRRDSSPRFESSRSDDSPRFESRARNDTPRYEAPQRNEAPRYEAPQRNESPRYEAPQRNEAPQRDDSGSSAARELDRLSRDDNPN